MLYSKIVVAFLDNYSYLTAMTTTLNQISSDRAFINGFKAQMAYYRHMCRMAEKLVEAPDLAYMLDPNLVDALVAWEHFEVSPKLEDQETQFLVDDLAF